MRRVALACLILVLAVPAVAAPRLTGPADLTDPRPAPVRLTGAEPGAPVTIVTTRRASDGQTLVARATFIADRAGTVDVAAQAPTSGNYAGVEPLGLFWSAAPRAARADDPNTGTVAIAVEGGAAGMTARSTPDATRLVSTTDTPFPGAIFTRPAGPGRHPVIIVLGGSEGGSSTARTFAPLFAARGYATLGLPYYDPGYDPTDRVPGLPSSFRDIPVDRLAAVRAWIATRPDADADRIGIWGASKGAEFALIAATRYRWVKAVAAIVPSDVVWEGWGAAGAPTASFAFDGKGLPFQPYDGMAAALDRVAKGQPMNLRQVHLDGRKAFPERLAAARIPVETYRGALLVAGGGRDAIWPSGEMARTIAATRGAAGLATMLLVYPDAGHGLGGPGTAPAAPLADLGGDGIAAARARAEVWRATFTLFDTALHP